MSYYDETAEKALLGVALLAPKATAPLRLTEADFHHPVHGSTWEAIHAAHTDGLTPDATTVLARVPEAHRRFAAELLVEVVGLGAVSNTEAYADTIRDRAERRRIASVLDGARQRLDQPDEAAHDTLAYIERHVTQGGQLDQAAEKLWTLDEFLDRDLPPVSWVIPDLLAEGERLVLTGTEGMGKSVLMRQVGVMVSAGLDPFTLASIPAKRVLFVDCENPERIMMSRLGELRQVAHARRTTPSMYLRRFPQGLDLASPRDRLELHHLCAIVRPDLLLIGPAYKLYIGGSGAREEDLARQVTATLDGLREEFGFALILEHHSPHAAPGSEQRSVRPIGSSLWLRWPEFGMGIRPQQGTRPTDRMGEMRAWRGPRDERPWPTELVSGGPGALPWVSAGMAHPQRRAS